MGRLRDPTKVANSEQNGANIGPQQQTGQNGANNGRLANNGQDRIEPTTVAKMDRMEYTRTHAHANGLQLQPCICIRTRSKQPQRVAR